MRTEVIEHIVQASYKTQQQVDVRDMMLTSAPNILHKDGRIYFKDELGNYLAVTVSPLNPKFKTQIEHGVWPVVNALVKKGYLTVSSCEGHDGSDYYVKIVFDTEVSAQQFIDQFPKIKGLVFELEYQSANVIRYIVNGQAKYRPAGHDENIDKYQEVKYINMLFNRSYTDCCYVIIKVYPRLKSFNPFKQYAHRNEKKKYYAQSKSTLNYYIDNHVTVYEA